MATKKTTVKKTETKKLKVKNTTPKAKKVAVKKTKPLTQKQRLDRLEEFMQLQRNTNASHNSELSFYNQVNTDVSNEMRRQIRSVIGHINWTLALSVILNVVTIGVVFLLVL